MEGPEVQYAGFWIRAGATMIDCLIILLITTPLLISIYGWAYFGTEKAGFFAGPADVIISWVLPAAAVIIFWKTNQATPGKMVFSVKIVDAGSGGVLSAGQSIGSLLCIPGILHSAWIGLYLDRVRQEKTGMA